MTTTKVKLRVGCLRALTLLFCLGANAGHLPCSTILDYPSHCPVTVDMKYMRLAAGSYNQCVERVNYGLAPGTSGVVFQPPAQLPSPLPRPDPAVVNAVIPHVESLLTRTVALRNDLDQRLTQAVRSALRHRLVTVGDAHGRITGPITVSLLGQPSGGILRVRFGFGLDVGASVRLRGVLGVLGRARVTARANSLLFSANYNVSSGSVSGVTLMGTQVRLRFNVRLFHILPARLTLTPDIQLSLNGQSFNIFGLDSDVPEGRFVHNGTDYGLKIKRQLRDFVERVDVTITQGGKRLANAYLNISVGGTHLTAGSIERAAKVGPRRRQAAVLCVPP